MVFLEKVESYDAFPPEHVAALEKLYSLDKSDNAEIKLRFYQIALKSGPEYAEKAAGGFPIGCGCRPRRVCEVEGSGTDVQRG